MQTLVHHSRLTPDKGGRGVAFQGEAANGVRRDRPPCLSGTSTKDNHGGLSLQVPRRRARPETPSFRRKPESIFKQNDYTPAFHLLVICGNQSKKEKQRQKQMDSGFRRNDEQNRTRCRGGSRTAPTVGSTSMKMALTGYIRQITNSGVFQQSFGRSVLTRRTGTPSWGRCAGSGTLRW